VPRSAWCLLLSGLVGHSGRRESENATFLLTSEPSFPRWIAGTKTCALMGPSRGKSPGLRQASLPLGFVARPAASSAARQADTEVGGLRRERERPADAVVHLAIHADLPSRWSRAECPTTKQRV
jgi:hypothetical protein